MLRKLLKCNPFVGLILAISLFVLPVSCKKYDPFLPELHSPESASRIFFQSNDITEPEVLKLLEYLKKDKVFVDYLPEFIKKNGVPVWTKTMNSFNPPVSKNQTASTSRQSSVGAGQSTTGGQGVIFVPLRNEQNGNIQSFIAATKNGENNYRLQLYNQSSLDQKAIKTAELKQTVLSAYAVLGYFENTINGKGEFPVDHQDLGKGTMKDIQFTLKRRTPSSTVIPLSSTNGERRSDVTINGQYYGNCVPIEIEWEAVYAPAHYDIVIAGMGIQGTLIGYKAVIVLLCTDGGENNGTPETTLDPGTGGGSGGSGGSGTGGSGGGSGGGGASDYTWYVNADGWPSDLINPGCMCPVDPNIDNSDVLTWYVNDSFPEEVVSTTPYDYTNAPVELENAEYSTVPSSPVGDLSNYYTESQTVNLLNNLMNDEDMGSGIELYMVACFKGNLLIDLSHHTYSTQRYKIGEYTLTPHYDSNNNLLFYSAWRTNGLGIEYIIRADKLSTFVSRYRFYKYAADLFYMGGKPSMSQIQIAAGDRMEGLMNMWGDALKNPLYYTYLGNILVATSCNISSLRWENVTRRNSKHPSYHIKNVSFEDFRAAIRTKQGVEWQSLGDGKYRLQKGSYTWISRPTSTEWSGPTIDLQKNGSYIGKFRFDP